MWFCALSSKDQQSSSYITSYSLLLSQLGAFVFEAAKVFLTLQIKKQFDLLFKITLLSALFHTSLSRLVVGGYVLCSLILIVIHTISSDNLSHVIHLFAFIYGTCTYAFLQLENQTIRNVASLSLLASLLLPLGIFAFRSSSV